MAAIFGFAFRSGKNAGSRSKDRGHGRSHNSHALALLALLAVANSAVADPTSDERSFDLQAHRGGRGLMPENTLVAFAHALELGVTTLELDVAVTADGVVVVSHDRRLNRDVTRDGSGEFLAVAGPPLYSLKHAQLQSYEVGHLRPGSAYAARFPEQQGVDSQRIPTLAALFDMVAAGRYRDVRFNIETKLNPLEPETTLAPEPFVRAVLAPIRKARLQSRTTIQSFDWRTLEVIQRLAPKLQTVALTDQQAGDDTIELGKPGASPWLGGLDVDDFAGSVPRTVQASGARVWSPNYLDLDAALVAEAHALGLAVVPWTVNEPADMERVLGFGVDGMISDRPDLLRALLQKKGIAVPAAAKPP